jgi:hypothetical protein
MKTRSRFKRRSIKSDITDASTPEEPQLTYTIPNNLPGGIKRF